MKRSAVWCGTASAGDKNYEWFYEPRRRLDMRVHARRAFRIADRTKPAGTRYPVMPKSKPIGPMRTQTIGHGSITPTLPMMPTFGRAPKASQQAEKAADQDAVRRAEARITRRNSLQKQRDAQKGQAPR
jgi:hypothetical protein